MNDENQLNAKKATLPPTDDEIAAFHEREEKSLRWFMLLIVGGALMSALALVFLSLR